MADLDVEMGKESIVTAHDISLLLLKIKVKGHNKCQPHQDGRVLFLCLCLSYQSEQHHQCPWLLSIDKYLFFYNIYLVKMDLTYITVFHYDY